MERPSSRGDCAFVSLDSGSEKCEGGTSSICWRSPGGARRGSPEVACVRAKVEPGRLPCSCIPVSPFTCQNLNSSGSVATVS